MKVIGDVIEYTDPMVYIENDGHLFRIFYNFKKITVDMGIGEDSQPIDQLQMELIESNSPYKEGLLEAFLEDKFLKGWDDTSEEYANYVQEVMPIIEKVIEIIKKHG